MNKLYLITLCMLSTRSMTIQASEETFKVSRAMAKNIYVNAKVINQLTEKRNDTEEALTCLGHMCCRPCMDQLNNKIQSLTNETKNLVAIKEQVLFLERAGDMVR